MSTGDPNPVRPAGPSADPARHRKNAAEWVMWTALQPVAWVVRLWLWGRSKISGREVR
ncbi:MAG: hypothetical protein JWO31_3496 [Phycisphaerales bacterium]|nr:hypothetical protein [Phycisphaerales bacterium]